PGMRAPRRGAPAPAAAVPQPRRAAHRARGDAGRGARAGAARLLPRRRVRAVAAPRLRQGTRMIDWQERYAVSVAVIDGQHRERLQLVTRLLQGRRDGRERAELVETLRELVRATEHNVATEERLMQEHGLSPLHHADAHTRLLEAIRRFDLRTARQGV